MTDVNVEGFPLSPQQRHLWTLTREPGGESPYWSRCTVHIRGPLDVAALGAVIDGLAGRYEILRTSFHTSEEMAAPLQVIGPATGADAADPGSRSQLELASVSPQEHRLVIGVSALRADRAALQHLVADLV